MKLLLCKSCSDVIALGIGKFRKCECGLSSGRYLDDNYNAEIKGEDAIAICFLNSTLAYAVNHRPESGERGIEFIAFVAAKDHPTIKLVPQEL